MLAEQGGVCAAIAATMTEVAHPCCVIELDSRRLHAA